MTVSGFFFPGFDGLKGSARCKFGETLSTPTLLEAKDGIIVCASPARPDSPFRTDAGGPGYEKPRLRTPSHTLSRLLPFSLVFSRPLPPSLRYEDVGF